MFFGYKKTKAKQDKHEATVTKMLNQEMKNW